MFINYLVNFLHLENDDVAVNYVDWYAGAGQIWGAVIPFVLSLLMVILFYYVFAKAKAANTMHWCLFGLLNMVITFFVQLFVGRASLANYVADLGDEYEGIWENVVYWPFTTDLWIYALNGVFWALVFYFVLSVILKKWSPVFNVPFGKSYKQSKF